MNLDLADKIATGVLECCKSHKFNPITVNVVDASGLVVVSKRMDGCSPVGVPEFSLAKAYTCIVTKNCSRAFRDKYTTGNDPAKFCQMTSMVAISGGKMAPFPGGVLVKCQGQIIGAVGVSGATGDEDEFCAIAGIKNAQADLVTVPEKHSLKQADDLIEKFEKMEIKGEPIDFVIPPAAQFYDNARPELKAQFEGLDFARVRSITLSANSYGTEACQWIADEILSKCVCLSKVNFSDMFVSRLRSDLPISLKILMNSIMDRGIESLDLSHNAFGPDGVKSF